MKNLLIAFSLLMALVVGHSCSKEYSLENAAIVPAVGTLKDDTGQCPIIIIRGAYIEDSAMTDSNRIQFMINVQQPGTYRIQTNQVNGVRFVDSGFFAQPGKRLVTLKAYGKAIADTIVSFDITWDTSVCSFPLEFESKNQIVVPPPNVFNDADSAWAFTEDGVRYYGPFDGGVQLVNPMLPAQPITGILLRGSTWFTGDTSITMLIGNLTGQPLAAKTYESNNQQEGVQYNFADTSNLPPVVLHDAGPTVAGVKMTFVVTAWDATTKIIEGTFSGTARGPGGSTRTITDGKFKGQVP